MTGKTPLAEPPQPFQPERRERNTDMQERKETILREAGIPSRPYMWARENIVFPSLSRIWATESESWMVESEPIMISIEPEFEHHEQWWGGSYSKEKEPFEPENIERDDVSQILSEFNEQTPSAQEAACHRILDIYEEIDSNELSAEEVINIQQMRSCAEDLGRESWIERAELLKQEYFEGIEEDPLTSMRSGETLEEPLSFDEARQILEEREEHLRETSKEVFDEVDEENVKQMQRAYLRLIWDNIEPE